MIDRSYVLDDIVEAHLIRADQARSAVVRAGASSIAYDHMGPGRCRGSDNSE